MDNVVSYFDAIAPSWDKKIQVDYRLIKNILQEVQSPTGPFKSILDIGCGTGTLFPLLLERLQENGTLWGLDPSAKMLEVASAKFNDPRIKLIKAFSENIPIEDESIDLITVFSCFPHLEDKRACLKEWFRVLVPKGMAFVFHSQSREKINSIHKALPSPINNHLLDCAETVAQWASEEMFSVLKTQDDDTMYLLILQKP
ncbi:Methyltransferase type 11 [Thermovirga lienii DSM 17291]|uniref:Methyltransferase type 11 n=1 Tax=Thermovirga lienii (strain ATCC BAA-1197 / DSM 17291 / Cas60314) TaxID=580340 RepID=G7V7I1_THELD|nr:Methyltransferase type 11 [Thermovirga lienii DSM 17291]HCD71164.1 class I SAM-dependent methyltransferase [Thermovirga lienii]